MRWLLPLLRERRCQSLSRSLEHAASRLTSRDQAGVELLRSRLMAFTKALRHSDSSSSISGRKTSGKAACQKAEALLSTIESLSSGGQRKLRRKEVVQLIQLLEADAATERSLKSVWKVRPHGSHPKYLQTLGKVASQYAAEAADENKASRQLRRIAWAFVLLAIMIAVTGLTLASLGSIESGWPTANFGIVAMFVAGFGGIALAMSERRRRAERELSRLRQHLDTLEPYLQRMDGGTSTLIRAILAARIFSRGSGEDESLWEPMWPSADQLLAAQRKDERRNQR
jgi:hypothetical protein